MTGFDRPDSVDRVDRRLISALDEIAAPSIPAYLDDVFRVTARTRQRPRWTFPERWLPMTTFAGRTPAVLRSPVRPVALLVILALLAAAVAVAIVGSRPRVPDPFGLAANGVLVYSLDGRLYARDAIAADGRPFPAAPDGKDEWPELSPDGTHVLWQRTVGEEASLWIGRPDGSEVRELVPPPVIEAWAGWHPDSGSIAVVDGAGGTPRLSIVRIADGNRTYIDTGELKPDRLLWRPPDGREALLRATRPDGSIGLFLMAPDGTELRDLGLPTPAHLGPGWDLSGPAFSPDGRTIAYNAVERDRVAAMSQFRVHLVGADGSGDRPAAPPPDPRIHEGWPVFSPDGTRILVHRWTWKGVNTGEGWIAVLPADGSAPARDVGPKIAGGEETGIVMGWSPDGTRALLRTDNTEEVYSIDPATGAWELLPWADQLPGWQRRAP